MDEVIDRADPRRRRLPALIEVLQARKQSIADELAAWSPMTEEERVEYLVGFLDPDASWQAMTVEGVRAFPGAMARTEAMLGDLVEALREVMIGDLLLDSVEEILSRLGPALTSVRREAAEHSGLEAAVADFDRALAGLDRLGSCCRSAVEERRASLSAPGPALPVGHDGLVEADEAPLLLLGEERVAPDRLPDVGGLGASGRRGRQVAEEAGERAGGEA